MVCVIDCYTGTLWVLPAVCYSGGVASYMSYNVVSWRPCFMQVMPAVYLVMFLLSGDHVLCVGLQELFGIILGILIAVSILELFRNNSE